MSYCININHPEYIQLLQNSNLKPAVLKAKIGVWMEENNSTDFPTLEELNVTSGTVNATLKIIDALEKIQRNVFSQDKLQGWVNDLQKQGASSQQIELFKEVAKPGMTKDQIATSIAASYSYTVEINTAIEKKELGEQPQPFELSNNAPQFTLDGNVYKMRSDIEFDEEGPSNITTFYKNNEQISTQEFIKAKELAAKKNVPTQYYSNLTVPGGTNYTENEIATPEIIPSIKGHAQFATDKGIGWFRSDESLNDKPIWWLIEPLGDFYKRVRDPENADYYNDAIKYKFNNEQEAVEANKKYSNKWTINYQDITRDGSKTRRILEVQSDLFQKGRDKEDLILKTTVGQIEDQLSSFYIDEKHYFSGMGMAMVEPEEGGEAKRISFKEYDEAKIKYKELNNKSNTSENRFLQLLNKDNNWVTFFVKSVIQDSAKKGYEKVLFPSGDTASKVEGHTTLEEFKKQKEDRIKELENKIEKNKNYTERYKVGAIKPGQSYKTNPEVYTEQEVKDILSKIYENEGIDKAKNEIVQLKQELERVEGPEGLGALKPIYNFYENTVKNILNKQYGKENVKQITDEYGNTWNEVSVEVQPAKDTILYQTDRAKSYQQRAKTIYFNEVRGKQLSNSDISNINAKLRKLSDEIGDVNWNLRQSNNTNNYYIAGYKNAPVTMDDYYSPYAGGMFRQLTTQSLESRVEELDKKLMSWAKKHGISVEALKAVMEKFPDRYDGTALGIADFAKNLIAIGDGARIDTLPEEVAHFAIELLIKDPTVVQALEEVVSTPEYAEVKEDYKDIYEEEIDFRKEALGKILAQEIVTNFKQAQENPNNGFWSKILDIANKFFNWVGINFSKKAPARTAIEAVVIPLANSILNQEYLGTADNVDLSMEDYATEALGVTNNELENKLKTFFNQFGFQYKEGDSYTDLLNKIIYTSKTDDSVFINNSVKALSQLLLANTNIDFHKLEDLIENTPEFKNALNNASDYIKNTYKFLKDGNRIPMEEWVSYIKEYNKIKNIVLEKYLKESLLEENNSTGLHSLIIDFINWFKDLFNNAENLKEVTDALIQQVLFNQREVIINSKDLQNKERVTLAKALEESTHGKDIIKTFGEFGLILTGSVSAAEQGSVFRKTGKLLHDIDWVVPKGFTKDFNQKLKDTFSGATLVREFDSLTYYTQTYIVPPKGYTISNLTFFKPEIYGKNKYIASYDVLDKNGNVVSNYRRYYDVKPSGKVIENKEVYNEGLQNVNKNLEAVSVDFFQNKEELKYEPYVINIEGVDLKLSNWLSSFTEKLKYGRAKDLLDYANFIPNDVLPITNQNQKKNKIFYQVTPNAQPVSNSNVEQKKKFLEEVVLKLTSRVNRFKNTAKSQTEIAALTIEIEKLQKLVAQSEFDLGISSFAQLASKELDSILAYLNKSLKNKTLNGEKLGLAQEFEEVYTSLFLELKQSMYEYEFEEDDIEALTAIIDNVENKLKQAEAMTKTLRKMLSKRVLEKGNLNAYGEKIDPNFNADEIVEATDEDMSSWRLWLGNYKFSNSGIIRTAHKIIFDSIAKVKRFTVQTGNEILQAQEKFLKAGYKIDELVQKDKDGKPTQYFVREINYSSYYAAIQETKANIAKALGRDDYSLIQVSLLEKDEKDVYNKFWSQFFENNTKKVTNVNPDGTISEARMPSDKYLEKDFLKKMEDPSFSEYYNLIIAKKREAVNKLPVQYRTENLVYSLPAIRKSFLERIGSKDQSYLSKIKGITKESFFVDQDDTIFGDLQALNNKMVPIHFTRKFDNISDLSFDIARTVTLFAEMAENYKEMNAISGDLTAVQSTLAERKYGKKKGIQSADYEALETMLDTHVFGVEKKNINFTIPENDFTKKIGIDNKQFSWTKASQRFTSFMRTNNLAFNPATSIAGWLKGSGDSIIEDQIGIYTTNESKNWSRVEFMSNLGHVIGEIGKPKQTNKMHLILQENEIVDINRMLFETTKNRVTRKTLNRDVFYVTFASGDYGLKGRATLAVYDNHRLYNDQFITRAKFYEKTAKEKGVTNDKKHQKEVGKQWESLREKSLYNAYEVVDGKLKIKDEFAPYIPDALANSIKGKVEHLANYLDGTLSPTDKGKLSRGIAGDFLLMHRGWFIGMMDTRLKRNNINMISEEEEVGTYRATGSFLVEAFKQILVKDKNLKGAIVAWNNLSDPYKRGVMKTALDLLYLNIAAIVAAIFNAAADNADDDDFTLQYTAYQLNRLLLEQGAAWSPAELIQMIDEPVVGARFIKDVLDITEAFNFGEVYKAGMYEDKSHARKWWMKKLPTRNLYELQFPELKNKFIKNLVDSHYYEYFSDEQKHSIVSKKSMFDWLIPFNEGYSEELQQNNVRQVVDYLEEDNQEEYNEFN